MILPLRGAWEIVGDFSSFRKRKVSQNARCTDTERASDQIKQTCEQLYISIPAFLASRLDRDALFWCPSSLYSRSKLFEVVKFKKKALRLSSHDLSIHDAHEFYHLHGHGRGRICQLQPLPRGPGVPQQGDGAVQQVDARA